MQALLDPVFLARLQFAFTVGFHIVFPAFTIGLASYLAVLEALWLLTKREVYMQVFRHWLKIFAVTFAMGVVSGIVMSYQFGTNWSVFSDRAGPVVGPLMGYEVLTAFFLEAGFLGVTLFGMKRVGKGLHFAATAMVAFGTFLSAFWILAVNSWMQTPQGHVIAANGQFVPESWLAVIFNPSFPYRLVHMVLAAYLTTALVVGAVGAWHLLRDRANAPARVMFSMAMWMIVATAPVQIVVGDFHGLNTLAHQPAKIAAMEGHYETQRGAPLYLFGWPDDEAEKTRYGLAIPKLGSLILTHEWEGELKGLKDWPKEDRPPAALVFWSFRVMVGLGVLMALLGLAGLAWRWRGRLYDSPVLQRAAIALGPAGFVAVIAGWIVTEVGRQPYTIYGLMRTSESVSPIGLPGVASSLIGFIVVYFAVFGAGIFYIFRLMGRTPGVVEPSEPKAPIRTAGITPGPGMLADNEEGP